jgi:hypothetical protein
MKNFIEFINESKKKIEDDFLYDPELTKKLKYTIDCAEKYKKCYFWHGASNSKQRTNNEINFTRNYPDYKFEYNGDKYEVSFHYSESSNNIRFSLDIYKNDNKSNLTVIKNIYNKLNKLETDINKFNL